MSDQSGKGILLRPSTPTTPLVDKPNWPSRKDPPSPTTPASITSNKPQWPKSDPTPVKPKKTVCKRITSALGHLAIIIFLAGYTAAGGAAFRYLERPHEMELDAKERQKYNATRTDVLETLVDLAEPHIEIRRLRNIIEEKLIAFQAAILEAERAGVDLDANETDSKWKFGSSFFFAATVVTTIGYGNIAPETTGGRIFCIIYALLGIPLTLIAIGDMGKLFASLVKTTGKFLRKYIFRQKKKDDEHDEATPHSTAIAALKTTCRVLGAIALLLIYIAIGAAIFCVWEKEWTYFEAFYFCFITMTTIGLGDLVPHHQMYMMLCTGYILIGLAVTSTCIELARSEYEKSWQRLLDASRRLHGASIADTLRKLNDQIETHGEIVDFSIMKDIRKAIKGLGHEHEHGPNNVDPHCVVYESNI